MGRIRIVALSAALLVSLAVSAAVATPAGARNWGMQSKDVCAPQGNAVASCTAKVVVGADGVTPAATSTYSSGFRPVDLQSAYNITPPAPGAWAWNGHTVAIVDANDDPRAESDLAVYRSTFGLSACTTANGCFTKVNQSGTKTYPTPNTGWGQEISLDLDMASAMCPNCKIVLVEATSASINNLGTAVNTAVTRFAADAVSNSYGASEFNGETSTELTYYKHPGTMITASTGDSGYGVEFPAASQFVTAVGGTTLAKTTTNARGWTESAWSGAGSGCSKYEPKPAWQTDTGCAKRTVADVSAVANPSTGVAVYDSYGSSLNRNWMVFGGTSVASPIIASIYALAGNAKSLTYGSYPYAHTASLNDAIGGSTGTCSATASYLCTAKAGYDGPTGLGTPNGLGAF